MPSLSRRLQRLEANCREDDAVVADRCQLVWPSALEHLTVGELRGLLEAYDALQEGREYTSQGLAALHALNTAMNLECQKAGVSRAKFDRYHCENKQAAR